MYLIKPTDAWDALARAGGEVAVVFGAIVLTTGPLKWLLGGPGIAYLYVRDQLVHELHPRVDAAVAV